MFIEDIQFSKEEAGAFLVLQSHPSWPVFIEMLKRDSEEKMDALVDPDTEFSTDVLRGIIFRDKQIFKIAKNVESYFEAHSVTKLETEEE